MIELSNPNHLPGFMEVVLNKHDGSVLEVEPIERLVYLPEGSKIQE